MLSDKALQEFRGLYKEEFGKEISDADALEFGTNLLNFFNHIYRPLKRGWLNEYKNYNDKSSKLQNS